MDTVNVCADSFDIRFFVHVLDYNYKIQGYGARNSHL
jgi:hypothetical protein